MFPKTRCLRETVDYQGSDLLGLGEEARKNFIAVELRQISGCKAGVGHQVQAGAGLDQGPCGFLMSVPDRVVQRREAVVGALRVENGRRCTGTSRPLGHCPDDVGVPEVACLVERRALHRLQSGVS